MELHGFHLLGDEKHQMLNLNRRLETYLGRVKLLEEENAALAEEIGARRRSGTRSRRKGLDEELLGARLELEEAWRERLLAEAEVGRLAEELRALDLQEQREARAHVEARTMMEQSRKELEEEQRAQMWLREKVTQLEHEMSFLIQTHQEDVVHLEATLIRPRATGPPQALRSQQTPDLLQLGQEYWQRASAAWQEAEEAHHSQLAQLEESLHQATGRLSQAGRERSENQLRLQDLEREAHSARDVRLQLETSAAQREEEHHQELHRLQAYTEEVAAERAELGEQMERLLVEKRELQQLRTTLSLEVVTYRSLLDSEGLGGTGSSKDAGFSSPGARRTRRWTTSCPPLPVYTAAAVRPLCSRKPFNQTTKISGGGTGSLYPKILQDGPMEKSRPQTVLEKVLHAEPLSPPGQQDVHVSSEDHQGEEHRSVVEDTPGEEPRGELGVGTEFPLHEEIVLRQFTSEQNTECPRGEEQEKNEPEESSGSESGSVIHPTREPGGSSFNQPEDEDLTDETKPETCSDEDETEVEDLLLYPDGEEMDTWDSVMEKKNHLRTDGGEKRDAEKTRHAQPEEDVSSRDAQREIGREITKDEESGADTRGAEDEDPPPEEEEEEEEEDSQNISVSWRTEVESDSYAQDNTLADTRPLIRYKSDEADAHPEESEKMAAETWSEGKNKRFGTMEDLCEEEEKMDEEYPRAEVGASVKDTGSAEERNQEVSENYSEEEEDSIHTDEELERDRAVEKEMENHFAGNPESGASAVTDQDLTGVMDPSVGEKLRPEEEEARGAAEKGRGEDGRSVSMATRDNDGGEDVSHFIHRPDPEEITNSKDSTAQEEVAPSSDVQEVTSEAQGDPGSADWFLKKPSEEAVKPRLHDDIFGVKDSSGKWASSLKGGATYRPDEPTQFAEGPLWEDLDEVGVVGAQKEQEVKQVPSGKVAEHSEESEGESWCSGEEPV